MTDVSLSEGAQTEQSSSDSEFVAVVFHNVQECYPPELSIECRYTIKPTVTPTSRDWVGIFRVGWQSLKDYVMYEWSPMPSVKSSDGKSIANRVVFPGKALPKSDDEFYQFCYVSYTSDIRGASVPFQIKTKLSEPELECLEVEDEDGATMLLVKNKTAILEEQLSRALEETVVLKSSKETTAKDLRNANERILLLEDQKADLVAERRKLHEKNETMVAEVEILKKSLEEKKHELDREWIAREDSTRKIDELELKNEELMKSLDSANKRADEFGVLIEAERRQNTQVQKNEVKLVAEKCQYLEAMASDRKVIESLTNDLHARHEEIKALNNQTAALKKSIKSLINESTEKNKQIENLQQELEKESKEFINNKQLLFMEIKEKTEKINEMCSEFKNKQRELTESQLEKENIKQTLENERIQAAKLLKDSKQESDAFAVKIDALKDALQEKQEIICKLEYEFEDMSNQLAGEKDKNAALEEDYETTVRVLEEQLEGERAFNKSLCSQSDRNVAELEENFHRQLALNEEITQHLEMKNNEVKRLEAEVESINKQIYSYEERVQKAMTQFNAADSEVQTLLKERESLQTTLSDAKEASVKSSKNSAASMYALQTAHTDLKKKYLQSQKEKEELWRERNDLKKVVAAFQQNLPADDLRNQIEDLRAKNEDLRVRLNMGAEAYKVKFIEYRRLQIQMKKMQRSFSSESLVSGSESSVSDMQGVVLKLQQSLDEEKQLAQGVKKVLEEEKALAVERNKEIEELRQENIKLRLRLEKATTSESVQQNHADSPVSLKQLQIQLENIRKEMETKDTKLRNMEQVFATEKSEKECLVQEIVSLQDGKKQLEEVSAALLTERKEREKLGEEARYQILQHEKNERELEEKVEKLKEEICRWKTEVNMYVEAERKNVETEEEKVKQPGNQGSQQQQDQLREQQAQGHGFSPTKLIKTLREAKYPPNDARTSTQEPWLLVDKGRLQYPPSYQVGPPETFGNLSPWQQVPQHPLSQPPQQPVVEYIQHPSDTNNAPVVPPQQAVPATVTPLVTDWSLSNRECPVCRILWPPGDDIVEFERHVNHHFATN